VLLLMGRTLASRMLACLLLLTPAWLAVQSAIGFADLAADPLGQVLDSFKSALMALPEPLSSMIVGPYGLVTMLPFLVLFALPTILIFAILAWLLTDTGLLRRMSILLDPWLRRVGLSSQSLVPVVMGFGCNVPAIVQTRHCDSCERCSSASAIAFGAACSYQLPATLAVFAAAGMSHLALPYLGLLAVTTLIYLRFALPRQDLEPEGRLIYQTSSLRSPGLHAFRHSMAMAVMDFIRIAFPIFVLICLIAGFLDWLGAITWLAKGLAPMMGLFNLPADSSVSVLMGSVRKDGIAIGLLAPESGGLKIPDMTAVQVLTLTYLASVLLPCMVTVLTLVREFHPRLALRMLTHQMLWATAFALVIGWGGVVLFPG